MHSTTPPGTFFEHRKAAGVWLLLLLLSIALALPVETRAQAGSTGTLTGVVQDPNGAAVPGVNVNAKNTGTGQTRSVTTDGEGRWTMPALAVGTYEITYQLTGFKTLKRERVEVEASVPRTLEDRLEVGGVAEEVVTVEGGAALVTPETSTLARQISSEQLVSVPTSTRSFTQLLSAEAGVNTDLSPVLTNGNGNQSPSVNGTRTTSTSLSFNGVDATNITSNEGSLNNNIAPAPETLSEVKLQTSLYDASTGRSGGGNFQLITKSGTNQLNGSAYYYLQNEKFNANDFFSIKTDPAPEGRRNEGGSPSAAPSSRNASSFGGYQRTKANTGFVPTASSITVLPQALQLISGDRTRENLFEAFRSLNPGITASIPNANAISDVAVTLLNLRNPATGDFLIPAPRSGGSVIGRDGNVTGNIGGNPYIRQRNVFPAEFQQDQFTLKLDGRLTSNNTLSGTFFFANFPGLDPFPDPGSLASPVTLKRSDRNRTLAVSDQHIFGPRLINEARFGYFTLNNTRILDDPFLAITTNRSASPTRRWRSTQAPARSASVTTSGGPARSSNASPSAAPTTPSTAASRPLTASPTI